MISLTEYSPSFNIPTSSNTCCVLVGYLLGTCWVLVGLLFTNCRLTPLWLYLKTTVTKLPSVLNSGASNPTRLHSSNIVPIPRLQLSRIFATPDTNSHRSSLRKDGLPLSLSPAFHYSEDKYLQQQDNIRLNLYKRQNSSPLNKP